jgi:hypothetical protein
MQERLLRRLNMEFQPIFMAGHSLRKHDKSHWEHKVRPSVVPSHEPKCAVCGFVALEKRNLIHADELWSFPEPPKVILKGVRPLCIRCHDAKDYAHLLSLIQSGARPKRAEAETKSHYCVVNGCSEVEFDEDFRSALALKREIEKLYNPNCRVVVDYGEWGRSQDKPRLSNDERIQLRRALEVLDTPIFIRGRRLSGYQSAVRTLQSIDINERRAILGELQGYVTEEGDDEPIIERDGGIQWK